MNTRLFARKRLGWFSRIENAVFGVSIPLSEYRPAPRLGTRRVENRLLRRLAGNLLETVR
ncbi:MAG: hypothetical protein KJ072_09515 [Verrucomicrobia bacterium]|nr:hypothetical protein [Verrucomicrobiota bacterium]